MGGIYPKGKVLHVLQIGKRILGVMTILTAIVDLYILPRGAESPDQCKRHHLAPSRHPWVLLALLAILLPVFPILPVYGKPPRPIRIAIAHRMRPTPTTSLACQNAHASKAQGQTQSPYRLVHRAGPQPVTWVQSLASVKAYTRGGNKMYVNVIGLPG